MVIKTCCSVAALLAVTVGMPFSSMAAEGAVAFEAESGTLGANYIIGNSSDVIYISNTNNNVGFANNRPQIPGRVATYSVTFPSAGNYDLYARVRVGPGGTADDSFIYANGFGVKSVAAASDWIVVDGVAARGFANPADVVTAGGSAGANVWKWINVSKDTGSSGGTPVTFSVIAANLTQTFQIGSKEDGFDMDKFVFGLVGNSFTVADLDVVTETPPPPVVGKIFAPRFVNSGDFHMSYTGTADGEYAQEWTDSLIPPVMWTPLLTNSADSYGLVKFTNTPASLMGFYRVQDVTPIDAFERPLVYAVEHTGANFPPPPLPTIGNLPTILPLPDPFAWANDPFGNTRSTKFSDWSHHRAEIKAQIENYEIGYKPPVDPSMIFAGFTSNSPTSRTLTVRTTNIVNGVVRTLTQTATITLPSANGTFPAIIGFNSASGNIPLGGRPIATINYNIGQVTAYGSQSDTHPYYQLYAAPYSPTINSTTTGQYSAWAWGCSRLLDGLYKLNGDLGGGVQLDLQRIGVTGCSYAGKGALFCGAFDERIALTIPQESGGGGVPNWRYSATEPSGTVEWLPNTDHNWFREDMFAFGTTANVSKLPHDHHQLMMMVAPRALFATANPQGAEWLSNPSAYVSFQAVQRVYETFGISERFGYNGLTGAGHCGVTTLLPEDSGAFLDRFLLGNTNINTITNRHAPANYSTIDYARWTAWWGTGNPVFPN